MRRAALILLATATWAWLVIVLFRSAGCSAMTPC